MKKSWLLLVLALCGTLPANAQEDNFTIDEDLLRSAEQWARENLDDNALRALQDVDRDRVKKFLAEVQKQLHGSYVVDLAGLKDAARSLVPLLEKYEETFPYAAWLKPRLDYFDVSDQFRLI